jgi:tetratricopeptide (TPR) repeat protein
MVRGLLAFVLLAICATARGAEINWGDIESRIQYNYYVEDRRALENLATSLGASTSPDPLRRYYAALVNYRVSLLTISGRPEEAKTSLDLCVSNLDETLRVKVDFPDALALQAACLDLLTSMKPLRWSFAGAKTPHHLLDKALSAEPRNPRVLLLDAVAEYDRPLLHGGSRERAFSKMEKAVAAFELERIGVEPTPGWGAADAYTFLARGYLDKGDAIAARGAIERALLLAPEYALARRLLTRITSG